MPNKRPSITVLTFNYPAPGHPRYTFVEQLVHAMIDEGADVTVVARQSLTYHLLRRKRLFPRRSIRRTEQGHTYTLHRLYTITVGNRGGWLRRMADAFNRRVIMRTVKRINSEVLYAHFWNTALPVYRYADEKGIPLFIACGEGDSDLENMVERLSPCDKAVLTHAVNGVVSVSTENRNKCIRFKLAKAEDIDVFPNCTDTRLFKPGNGAALRQQLGISPDDFVVCFVGGFIQRKGPDRVAEAIRRLNDKQIKAVFIGKPFDGYDYPFDCPGTVFKGITDHDALPDYLNCADVFVLPTLKEGCCNAIVEALAAGLPVISSDGPFNDDILNTHNSIRVNPLDIDAIAQAIKTLKDDAARRRAMADYSCARHDAYSIQGRARKILDFIEEKTQQPKP